MPAERLAIFDQHNRETVWAKREYELERGISETRDEIEQDLSNLASDEFRRKWLQKDRG
jgi:hypothetical protein